MVEKCERCSLCVTLLKEFHSLYLYRCACMSVLQIWMVVILRIHFLGNSETVCVGRQHDLVGFVYLFHFSLFSLSTVQIKLMLMCVLHFHMHTSNKNKNNNNKNQINVCIDATCYPFRILDRIHIFYKQTNKQKILYTVTECAVFVGRLWVAWEISNVFNTPWFDWRKNVSQPGCVV